MFEGARTTEVLAVTLTASGIHAIERMAAHFDVPFDQMLEVLALRGYADVAFNTELPIPPDAYEGIPDWVVKMGIFAEGDEDTPVPAFNP